MDKVKEDDLVSLLCQFVLVRNEENIKKLLETADKGIFSRFKNSNQLASAIVNAGGSNFAHFCIQTDAKVHILRILVNAAPNILMKTMQFMYPIHLACERDEIDIVKYILEEQGLIDQLHLIGGINDSIDCGYPLYFAVRKESRNVVELLCNKYYN